MGHLGMMSAARPLAYAQFLLLLLSFLCLTWAFIDNDFTVQYVATNSTACCRWPIASPRCGAPTRALCCCGC